MISDRVKSNLRASFRRSGLAKLGVVLLLAMVLVAVFAPVLATHDPTSGGHFDEETGQELPPLGFSHETTVFQDGERQTVTVEADSEHILGTNPSNQDVYSRFVYGARVSILIGFLGTVLAMLIGVPYGLVAGYYGGRVDDVMMRLADVMLSFPALVLALALIGAFDTSTIEITDPIVAAGFADGMPENIEIPGTVTVVAALVIWVWFARVARGEAISIRNQEYVTAAQSFGASNWTIIRRHVLPNSVTPIIVLATIQVAVIILLEASLAYLGFSGTTLSWGFEIEQGQGVLRQLPWVSIFPGLGIVLTVVGINLIGDWLRDALDPNLDDGERGV